MCITSNYLKGINVKDFISRLFCGLDKEYYLRQLFFGLLFFAATTWMTIQSNNPSKISLTLFFFISTLLYPYSRFVYESIMGFILGNNSYQLGGIFLLFALAFKVTLIVLCYVFAIFIAPVGLLYLYFRN